MKRYRLCFPKPENLRLSDAIVHNLIIKIPQWIMYGFLKFNSYRLTEVDVYTSFHIISKYIGRIPRNEV